jgi:hypothetical protein
MFTCLGFIGAVALLALAVCALDGDFSKGGLFAELAKRLARLARSCADSERQ